MIKLVCFVFLLLVCVACKEKAEENFYPIALPYAELRIAENEYGGTKEGKAARAEILQKHKLSADSFEKNMEEIKNSPEKWIAFQNSFVKILDSIADSNKIEEEP